MSQLGSPPSEKNSGILAANSSAATRSAARSSKGISWTLINFLLDLALFLTFVWLCWVAALTQFVFPGGSTNDSWRLFGVSIEGWRQFQFWTLCVFAIGVLVHIMLHWSWVCGVVEARFLSKWRGKRVVGEDGSRTLIGVMLLATTLLVMGLGLGAAAYLMERID